jgi:hypothetical protein
LLCFSVEYIWTRCSQMATMTPHGSFRHVTWGRYSCQINLERTGLVNFLTVGNL